MDIELTPALQGTKYQQWKDFLSRCGLTADENVSRTVLIWDEGELIATASRQENLLKCIAVDESRQGEGLTAVLLTQLRQDAFQDGHSHLFLYTKPKNKFMFSSLFFYPVAQTGDVLLMENRKDGIQDFLKDLPVDTGKTVGAAVMNCNPFTKGHRYLIETAAAECDRLYVFVLSEDKSEFSAKDRLEMVRLGTADISNVTVLPTGPYLISSATFPTYFLKDREQAAIAQCGLDIAVFSRYYIPKFGITHRYVGSEPTSVLTNAYNCALKAQLPIEVVEIPRLEAGNAPISASTVRSLMGTGKIEKMQTLIPPTTIDYLEKNALL